MEAENYAVGEEVMEEEEAGESSMENSDSESLRMRPSAKYVVDLPESYTTGKLSVNPLSMLSCSGVICLPAYNTGFVAYSLCCRKQARQWRGTGR